MGWAAVVDQASGSLLSVGDVVAAKLPTGAVTVALSGPPDLSSLMWDSVSRGFVARPVPTLVDRVQDLVTDPVFADLQAVYAGLSAANKTTVRNALGRLLGSQRFRRSDDPARTL